LLELTKVVNSATKHLQNYNHAAALDVIEAFFWDFCDYYIEIAKNRIWENSNDISAKYSLFIILDNLIRLFAPYIPYTTQEIWSWCNNSNIHMQNWSSPYNVYTDSIVDRADNGTEWMEAKNILSQIRGYKTEKKLAMNAKLDNLTVNVTNLSVANRIIDDVKLAGNVQNLKFSINC
jgi:valyl-tRNA synthetase